MSLTLATPPLVSCAVAIRCVSTQNAAAASQNLTWPGVTGVPAAVTVAVSVTGVRDATLEAGAPAAVMARVTVVEVAARAVQGLRLTVKKVRRGAIRLKFKTELRRTCGCMTAVFMSPPDEDQHSQRYRVSQSIVDPLD